MLQVRDKTDLFPTIYTFTLEDLWPKYMQIYYWLLRILWRRNRGPPRLYAEGGDWRQWRGYPDTGILRDVTGAVQIEFTTYSSISIVRGLGRRMGRLGGAAQDDNYTLSSQWFRLRPLRTSTQVGWIRNFTIRNFAPKITFVFCEILILFREISKLTFAKFLKI
jgi:hypothetical protein